MRPATAAMGRQVARGNGVWGVIICEGIPEGGPRGRLGQPSDHVTLAVADLTFRTVQVFLTASILRLTTTPSTPPPLDS